MGSWLILTAYAGATLLLVSQYQPKLAAQRAGTLPYDAAYRTVGGRLYWRLAPTWQHNRQIVPSLLAAAIGMTIAACSAGRRREAAA